VLPGADLPHVAGSRVVDFVLGGLDYQIEHHLFPNMPRPNLRHDSGCCWPDTTNSRWHRRC
jgi:hypothetical protein